MHAFHIATRCLAALGLALGLEIGAHAADWPAFLGPNGDGTSPETGLIDAFPESGPPIVWQETVGSGYASPVVKDDILILFHRKGGEEILEGRSAGSGKILWQHGYPSDYVDPFGYNNGPRSSPVIAKGRCYAFGAEGMLTCLDLQDGTLVWQRDTAHDFQVPQAFFGVGTAPLVWKDRLIVMIGAQPNSCVIAFDLETGETLWQSVGESTWDGEPKIGWPGEPPVVWRGTEKMASYATPVPANFHGNELLLVFTRQGLVLMDPKDGTVHDQFWFRAQVNSSVNAANPVVVGDKVVISTAYYRVGTVQLRVTPELKFEELWRNRNLEMHWATPIFHEGYLYAFSGRDEPDARFRCIDFETGELMWDQDESGPKRMGHPDDRYMRGSLIKADGKLIALGESGLLGLFALNPNQPEELSRWKVPGLSYPCWAAPVLTRGKLYLRSEDRLVCLDMKRQAE